MERNNDILTELKEISSFLAEIPRVNIRSVPADYFTNLEEKIVIHSLLHQNEIRNYCKQEKPGVPEGYFENLSESILSKIKDKNEGEEEETFSLLESLKNKHVFKVPPAYFEELSGKILDKTREKEAAKVISIGKYKWWKYAAAAMITGIMLISGFFIFNSGNKQLSAYLSASQQYKTSSQIEDGIASLKDDDIVSYLETHGNITDNELLLDNIDTGVLPDELDYLMDENTLNNFLKKINGAQQ